MAIDTKKIRQRANELLDKGSQDTEDLYGQVKSKAQSTLDPAAKSLLSTIKAFTGNPQDTANSWMENQTSHLEELPLDNSARLGEFIRRLKSMQAGNAYLKNPDFLAVPTVMDALRAARTGRTLDIGLNAAEQPYKYNAAAKLSKLMEQHLKSPMFPHKTEIPRSTLPVSSLSETELRDAGFVPSYIAVPEIGQSELRTWRHPFSGMHFHKHGDKWVYHVDTYPSMTMQYAAYKKMKEAGLPVDSVKITPEQAMAGVKHVTQEGFPGYVNYLKGVILGDKSLVDKDNRTLLQRVPRAALGLLAASLATSGISRAVDRKNKDWHIPESLASVGAFTGSRVLMDKLFSTGVDKGWFDPMPTWASTALLGGVPVASAVGSWLLANRLKKKLASKKALKDKNEQISVRE